MRLEAYDAGVLPITNQSVDNAETNLFKRLQRQKAYPAGKPLLAISVII